MGSLISVIILNYKGKDYIEECLDSVLEQTYEPLEIIVVDNASSDGSLRILKEKYSSKIKLIESNANLGFAGGNNLALEDAKGEFIALLNNDAIADRRWIEEFMSAVSRCDGTFGMWASKILFYEDREIIDTAGHLIYPDGLNRGAAKEKRIKGNMIRKRKFFSRVVALPYIAKRCWILSVFLTLIFLHMEMILI